MPKTTTNKEVVIDEIQPVSENTKSALPVIEVIKSGNIGLKKEGHEGMVQVHASMRGIYEKAGFEIVESSTKKK